MNKLPFHSGLSGSVFQMRKVNLHLLLLNQLVGMCLMNAATVQMQTLIFFFFKSQLKTFT